MNVIPRIFCTISSLSIVFWIYVINKGITLSSLLNKFAVKYTESCIDPSVTDCFWLSAWVSYPFFLLLLFGLAYLTTLLFKRCHSIRDLKADKINSVSIAGEDMAFTYFGLFFYALSVNDKVTLILTFIILCLGIFLTTRYLFNPFYLFLGYKFYKVHAGTKSIIVLSKKKYQHNDTISFDKLAEITPFSFVELT